MSLVGHRWGNFATNWLERVLKVWCCWFVFTVLKKIMCCHCERRFACAEPRLWLVHWNPPVLSNTLRSYPPPLQSGMTHQSCSGAHRKCLSIGQRRGRQHTLTAPACICIAEQRPGNTRSILMTSPHHSAPALPLCLLLKQARSLTSRKKRQASVREQGLPRKEEGLLVSGWREREGERTLRWGAEGDWRCSWAWTARTHRHIQGRQQDLEYCSVLSWILFCLPDLKFSSSSFSFSFVSAVLHSALGKWWQGTLWQVGSSR